MTSALSIRSLRKSYDNGFEALKGIDLDVAPGDFFALLGPNGAGKSTTIGILCSLVRKTSGRVEVFGLDIDRQFSQVKQQLGVVPQEFNFNQFETVLDVLINQAGYYGIPASLARQRSEQHLRRLDLWEKRNERTRMLSGGMKRRLMIARALIHEPKLLILDEPTAGVDIELRRSMWVFLQNINEQGTTIILTTHYLEEAESLCRNIAIIDQGEIVVDSSMHDLLQKLHTETFICDLQSPLNEVPLLSDYPCRLLDSLHLEVDVDADQSMNDLFVQLQRSGLVITSMRNKANRLEELFVKMVESGNARAEGDSELGN